MEKDDKLFIKDLTVRTKRGYLCVKVARKWNYDGNVPGGSVIYIGLILADEQGSSIYAQIPEGELDRLGSQIVLDAVYTIRKFHIRVCKPNYVPLDAQFMLQMTSFTTVIPSKVPTTAFPKYTYKITPFNEIQTTGETANRYIDVLGIVVAEGPMRTACPKGKDYVSTLKEITIKNLSGSELTVTLWEAHAQQFQLPTSSATNGPHSIVALFCGCLPKRIFNKIQVNAGNACRWFIDPQIPEAQSLYDSLKHRPVPVFQQTSGASGVPPPAQPKILQHQTLAVMNAMDPYDFPEEGCKCTVKITEIPPDQEWWYMGCQVCKKRLRNYGGTYFCNKCKCNTAVPLYKLTFVAADDTSTATFFCYDVVGRQIVRRNCDSLLRAIDNGPGLPDQIARAIGRTFTFAVTLTDRSYDSMDARVYSIDSCTFRPDPQSQIITAPPNLARASPSSAPQTLPAHPSTASVAEVRHDAVITETTEEDHTGHHEVVDVRSQRDVMASTPQTPPPTMVVEETPAKEKGNISEVQQSRARKRLAHDFDKNAKQTENESDAAKSDAGKKRAALGSVDSDVPTKPADVEDPSKQTKASA